MHKIVILRLEAPLMSFGGPIVDNYGMIQAYPSLSQLTGMFANALGYCHNDFDMLTRIQQNLVYSVCCLRHGEKVTDYQTVDLGQDFMVDTGWTTRNSVEGRGGASSKSTHIRFRDYLADYSFVLAVRFKEESTSLNSSRLADSLQNPARPLFVGRKCCIPSVKLFEEIVEAPSTFEAIKSHLDSKLSLTGEYEFWTSEQELKDVHLWELMVTDERDWKNQIHVGQHRIFHGLISLEVKV